MERDDAVGRGGRLFFDGGLSLELLRARTVHPPFHRISAAAVLLVIEYHHTYDSFTRMLGADSGVGVVGYGAGTAFVGSVMYASELDLSVQEISYFGDLDARGLRIPVDADGARGPGVPHVRPAGRLYRRLLEVGVPAAAPSVSAETAVRLGSWLPCDRRDVVATMLTGGRRRRSASRRFVTVWTCSEPFPHDSRHHLPLTGVFGVRDRVLRPGRRAAAFHDVDRSVRVSTF